MCARAVRAHAVIPGHLLDRREPDEARPASERCQLERGFALLNETARLPQRLSARQPKAFESARFREARQRTYIETSPPREVRQRGKRRLRTRLVHAHALQLAQAFDVPQAHANCVWPAERAVLRQ